MTYPSIPEQPRLFIAKSKCFWFPADHVEELTGRPPEDISDDGFVAARALLDVHGAIATERVQVDGVTIHEAEYSASNLGTGDEQIRRNSSDYLTCMAMSVIRSEAGHTARKLCQF